MLLAESFVVERHRDIICVQLGEHTISHRYMAEIGALKRWVMAQDHIQEETRLAAIAQLERELQRWRPLRMTEIDQDAERVRRVILWFFVAIAMVSIAVVIWGVV